VSDSGTPQPPAEGPAAARFGNWAEADPGERRRDLIRVSGAVALAWVLLIAVYYLLPFSQPTGLQAAFRVVAAIVIFVGTLVWQVRRIRQSRYPRLRAVEGLGVMIPLLIVIFAGLYESLSHMAATSFNQPLDDTSALYLSVTVFTTVGLSDITPMSDGARILVAVQMLIDLLILGAVIRLLFNTARATGVGPRLGPVATLMIPPEAGEDVDDER
jgi:voltage-gated potassium channel